jgi:hypothetical protein
METSTGNLLEAQFLAHLRALRGQVVILESDLAWFLGIEPARIHEAVEGQPELFPSDFVFRLTKSELDDFESQFPCLTADGPLSSRPRLAFTLAGVGMLPAAFPNDAFAQSVIPILRAIANYWKGDGNPTSTHQLVNRKS